MDFCKKIRKFEGTCYIPGDQLATMARYYRGANLNLNLTLQENDFKHMEGMKSCYCPDRGYMGRENPRGYDDGYWDEFPARKKKGPWLTRRAGHFPAVGYLPQTTDKSTNTRTFPARSRSYGRRAERARFTKPKKLVKGKQKKGKQETEESDLDLELDEKYENILYPRTDLKCAVCKKEVCSVCRNPISDQSCKCDPVKKPITCKCCQQSVPTADRLPPINTSGSSCKNLADLLLLLIGARMSKQVSPPSQKSCECCTSAPCPAVESQSEPDACCEGENVRKIFFYDCTRIPRVKSKEAQKFCAPRVDLSSSSDEGCPETIDGEHTKCSCCFCGEKSPSKRKCSPRALDRAQEKQENQEGANAQTPFKRGSGATPQQVQNGDEPQKPKESQKPNNEAVEKVMVCLPRIQSTLEELLQKLTKNPEAQNGGNISQDHETISDLVSALNSMTGSKLLAAQTCSDVNYWKPNNFQNSRKDEEPPSTTPALGANCLGEPAVSNLPIPSESSGGSGDALTNKTPLLQQMKAKLALPPVECNANKTAITIQSTKTQNSAKLNLETTKESTFSVADTCGLLQTGIESNNILLTDSKSSNLLVSSSNDSNQTQFDTKVPYTEQPHHGNTSGTEIKISDGSSILDGSGPHSEQNAVFSIHRMIEKVNETIAQIDSKSSLDLGTSRLLLRPEDRERLSFFVRLDDDTSAQPVSKPTPCIASGSRSKMCLRLPNSAQVKNKFKDSEKKERHSNDPKSKLRESLKPLCRQEKKSADNNEPTPGSSFGPNLPSRKTSPNSLIPRRTRYLVMEEESSSILTENLSRSLKNDLSSPDQSCTLNIEVNQGEDK